MSLLLSRLGGSSGTTLTQNLSDSVSATDGVSKVAGIVLSDSDSSSDNITTRALGLVISDSETTSDAIVTKGVGLGLSDGVAVSDLISLPSEPPIDIPPISIPTGGGMGGSNRRAKQAQELLYKRRREEEEILQIIKLFLKCQK